MCSDKRLYCLPPPLFPEHNLIPAVCFIAYFWLSETKRCWCWQRANEKCVFLGKSLTEFWFSVHVSWPPGSSSGAAHCARGLLGDTWEGHYEKAEVHRYDTVRVCVVVWVSAGVVNCMSGYLVLLACRNILLMLRGLALCARAILKLIIDKLEWSSQQSVLSGDNIGGH